MINHILVPTDFSHLANSALRFAVRIAEKTGAKIQLSHVIESPSASYSSYNVMGQVETHTELNEETIFTKLLIDRVKKNLGKLSKEYSTDSVQIKSRIYFDSPYKSIMERVKHDGIDLIIMGTRGASGFQEVLVGSNTEKVVRHSDVPVLAIKADSKNFELKKLVFASDFSENLDKIIPFVKDFQKLMGAEIMLVRVNTPNDFHSSRALHKLMEDFIKKHHLDNCSKHVYCDVNEEDGIIYFAEWKHADLIILPTHGRKGIAHLLGGSISEDVVNHASRPVLTMKIK